MKNRTILKFLTIILGIIFLVSGISKGVNIPQFAELLVSYGSTNLYYVAPIISSFEIFLGFSMVFMVNPKKTSLLALVVTFIFTAAFVYGNLFLGINDCGCFGDLIKISPYQTFIRNIVILALSFYILKNYPDEPSTIRSRIRMGVAVSFGLIALVVAILDLRSSIRKPDKFEFQGKNISEIPLPNVIKSVRGNPILVFIFLPTCSHCQRAVPIVKQYRELKIVESVVGLCSDTNLKADVDAFVKDFQVDFPVKSCSRDTILMLIKSYPTVLHIDNNIVVHHYAGSVPFPKSP